MRLTAAQKAATKRWTRSRADELAVANGCWFDTTAATRVVTFFEKFLRHSKGEWAGEPFIPLDWQEKEIMRPLFGWMRDDGYRRYNTAYIEIPKKNSKSTMSAGFILYGLVGDGEPGAEVYSAAASRDQASIVYREAASMVRKSPGLSRKIDLQESIKHMSYAATESWYKALSADAGLNEGMNIHFLVMDEFHAQPNDVFWNALMYGGAARRQHLKIIITTAGVDVESICYDYHTKAMEILEGTRQDDSFFAYVRSAEWAMRRYDAELKALQARRQEADAPDALAEEIDRLMLKKEACWRDEAVWKEANPALGSILTLRSFREAYQEAADSPRLENAFKRYRLNLWTQQEERWLPLDHWLACGDEFTEADLLGQTCYSGLDLASVSDFCALVLWFPECGNALLPYFWIPEETVKMLEAKGDPLYSLWARQGFLRTTPGNRTDYAYIRRDINALSQQFVWQDFAYDKWNSTHLITELIDDKVSKEYMEVRQGFASMSAPSKEFERMILGHDLRHNNHPVMTWCVGNVAVRRDTNENFMPCKELSKRKIDGVVAGIMALARVIVREKPQTSVYETRGILSL